MPNNKLCDIATLSFLDIKSTQSNCEKSPIQFVIPPQKNTPKCPTVYLIILPSAIYLLANACTTAHSVDFHDLLLVPLKYVFMCFT